MSPSRNFPSAIDPEVLDGLRSLQDESDPHFFRKYLKLFMSPIPDRIEAIESAIQTVNLRLLQTESHALKSSCGNTGAIKMSAICSELEQIAKGNEKFDVAAPLLKELKNEFQLVKTQIEALPEY